MSRAADPRVPNEAGFVTFGQMSGAISAGAAAIEARVRAAGYVTRGAVVRLIDEAVAGVSGFATAADVAAAEARLRAVGWVRRGAMVAYVTDAINAALGAIVGYATTVDLALEVSARAAGDAAEAAARDLAIAAAEARLRAAGWVRRGGMIAYVSDQLAAYLGLAGGTLTGPLVLAADPVVPLGAATKQYIDGQVIGSGSPTYLSHALCGGL